MATAYATMASVFMHKLGDWERGRRMAAVAVQLVEKAKALGVCGDVEQDTVIRLHFLVTPWIKPARSVCTQLIDGYKTCMSHGDVDNAFKIIVAYEFSQLLSGKELKQLEADIQCYRPQMEALKYDKWDFQVGIVLQAALNLMGKTENTTILAGSVVEEKPGVRQLWHQVQFLKRFLCAHFGEYKTGAINSVKIGKEWLKAYPGVYYGYDAFHQAICLYAEAHNIAQNASSGCRLAPSTSGRTMSLYKEHAYRNHALIKSWVKSGGPNHVHHLSILDAEQAALLSCMQKSKSKEVCKLYEKAIVDSVRGGFVNHAALTEERYADYLLEMDDKQEGIYHLENAIKRYSDWGAMRKVEFLREKLVKVTCSPLAQNGSS